MARGPPRSLLLHDNRRTVRLNISLVNYLPVSHQLCDNIPDLDLWLGQLQIVRRVGAEVRGLPAPERPAGLAGDAVDYDVTPLRRLEGKHGRHRLCVVNGAHLRVGSERATVLVDGRATAPYTHASLVEYL